MDFTGFAVVNPGTLTEINAHRQDAAPLHDHAFYHLRAGPDEAMVLNDGGVGLQRFKHTTNAYTTGKVNICTNLSAGTNGRPGIDHRVHSNMSADVHVAGH